MTFATDTTVCLEPRVPHGPDGKQGIPAVERVAAQTIIRALVNKLTPPSDPIERLRFTAIAEDLEWLDGNSAADLLDQPVERFGGAYGQLSAYALAVLAATELRDQKLNLIGHERLLQVIREQAHAEFAHLPNYLSTLWLVPATEAEHTAVYVGSLLMNRSGEACRPWLSNELPDHGRFLIVAGSTTESANCLQSPSQPSSHHRCDGVTRFTHLAIHSLAPC